MSANPSRAKQGHRLAGRGLLLLFFPCAAYFLLFHYVPMVGILLAFKEYVVSEGFLGSEWNGLENFERLFGSHDFLHALRNTLFISLLRLLFGFSVPIVLALLLNELRLTWLRRSVQTITYLPHLMSWVILGGIFLLLFSINGPLNNALRMMGSDPISFLTNDPWFLFLLIATGIWQSVGYGAVIYLAALAGISPTLYEASMIDGANRWQQAWSITVPSLAPTIVVLLLLTLGNILNAGFDQIYNMYNPLVYDVADILDTYVLRRLISLDIGLSTAAGVFKSVVGMLLIVLANRIANRVTNGEMGIW